MALTDGALVIKNDHIAWLPWRLVPLCQECLYVPYGSV